MVEALGFLIVAVVAVYVAWPLFNPSSGTRSSTAVDSLDDLRSRRLLLYREIADLEFDHRVGKVGEEDYRTERDGFVAEAASVLEQLDGDGPQSRRFSAEINSTERELEEEIRALRMRRTR
jgi:hypothetical protein